jgi:hypothetical protein
MRRPMPLCLGFWGLSMRGFELTRGLGLSDGPGSPTASPPLVTHCRLVTFTPLGLHQKQNLKREVKHHVIIQRCCSTVLKGFYSSV